MPTLTNDSVAMGAQSELSGVCAGQTPSAPSQVYAIPLLREVRPAFSGAFDLIHSRRLVRSTGPRSAALTSGLRDFADRCFGVAPRSTSPRRRDRTQAPGYPSTAAEGRHAPTARRIELAHSRTRVERTPTSASLPAGTGRGHKPGDMLHIQTFAHAQHRPAQSRYAARPWRRPTSRGRTPGDCHVEPSSRW
ncbi:MAG: hypothetical protein RLZZ450_365 [Pseudomonadota bacterium]|jgi:hypothetical protein